MNIWAVIPARSGSRGLPGKNLKKLHERPLLAWSIFAALDCGCFRRVLVSTESPQIAATAREWGAEVPFLRPAHLAGDRTPSVDVVLDLLERFPAGELPDAVALLQPTSPLRTAKHLREAVELFSRGEAPALVSVARAAQSPWWMQVERHGRLEPLLSGGEDCPNRSDPQQDSRPSSSTAQA
jgi:CMP-N-acetylneuraminic acid synthetase